MEQVCKDFAGNDSKGSIPNIVSQSRKIKQEKDNNQSMDSSLEEKQFLCGQCDYKYTTKYSLKRHVDTTHEGVCYPCNQCDYKATEKSQLKIHRLNS